MAEYLFLLGKTPSLAVAELQEVLPLCNPQSFKVENLFVKVISDSLSPQSFLNTLGGTVKIYRLLDGIQTDEQIAQNLHNSDFNKFILSGFGSIADLEKRALRVKEHTLAQGLTTRFKVIQNPYASVGITTKYREYFLDNRGVWLAEAVQNIDHWNFKDYSRPAVDPKSGMLPPKIARILVNLSIGPRLPNSDLTFLDPMCGSGTLLMEATELGLRVTGADISPKAVTDSRLNLAWFCHQFQMENQAKIIESDIHHLKLADIGGQLFDAIAFEGYLGPPHATPDKLDNLSKGMYKLYLGAFKRIDALLKPGCRLVMALPHFDTTSSTNYLKKLIDTCQVKGYNLQVNGLIYSRPKAKVKRAIYVLTKSK